ncbi:histidine ammonia-lyase-like [Clytia hemisphaerica]|uniref:Histidine ammonia-lyase n=3 Tax=Clytia hemisphaerica TaxID=252671 RepID=A0A7M5XD57_9CNID
MKDSPNRKLSRTSTTVLTGKMKLTVHYKGQIYVVPCGNGNDTIKWLKEEAVKRSKKLNSTLEHSSLDTLEARLQETHGLLMDDDLVCDVLDDNSLVYISSTDEKTNGEIKINGSRQDDDIFTPPQKILNIDGNTLTSDNLVKCGKGEYKLQLTKESQQKVKNARDLIDNIVAEKRVVYGINTGFGSFARVIIPPEKIKELQENLIRSHASGVGEALTLQRARSLLALRINVLAKGHSGISPENLNKMIAIFNAGCAPYVPERGTVGASGDLAPLSHVALGLMGEGKMWGPKTGWADAAIVLNIHNLKPISLQAKEGLALINGTQLITALGAEALERSIRISRQADVVAALTLEVLKGTSKAFSEEIHNARPHCGQKLVASRLRSLLHSDVYRSEVAESHRFCDRVQDAYTLRCCPQVHGVVHDTIEFVKSIISVELNSATDNPMVFADIGETMSGGNFHGEYPAKSLDYLAIGIHELANMSERRIERLINPAYSGLPAFLTKEGGLNSGLMIAHCTAAALVSENKVLTHPASVDSISTSAGQEDHVSMGGFSARKALTVVEHVEYVLAIELLSACQGIQFLRPLKSTEPLEAVYRLVRSVAKNFNHDRYIAPDIEAVRDLLHKNLIWEAVEPYMKKYEEEMHAKKMAGILSRMPDSPTGYSSRPASPKSWCGENGGAPQQKRPKYDAEV